MYYRIRNKERLLHPCEQEQIAAIFLKHGIKTKPEFDRYIDKYDWNVLTKGYSHHSENKYSSL